MQTVIGGQGRNCSMDGWTNHKTSNKLPVGIRFDPNVYFPCPNTRGYGKTIQRDWFSSTISGSINVKFRWYWIILVCLFANPRFEFFFWHDNSHLPSRKSSTFLHQSDNPSSKQNYSQFITQIRIKPETLETHVVWKRKNILGQVETSGAVYFQWKTSGFWF